MRLLRLCTLLLAPKEVNGSEGDLPRKARFPWAEHARGFSEDIKLQNLFAAAQESLESGPLLQALPLRQGTFLRAPCSPRRRSYFRSRVLSLGDSILRSQLSRKKSLTL